MMTEGFNSMWAAVQQQRFVADICRPEELPPGWPQGAGDLGPYTPCFVDLILLGEATSERHSAWLDWCGGPPAAQAAANARPQTTNAHILAG